MKVRIGLNMVQFSLSPYNISIIQTKPFIFRQRSLIIKCVSWKRLEITMSIIKGHNRFIPYSLHSDCKNVQKSALKSVNVQRTGKSILQMFAFSFLTAVIFADFCIFYVPPPSLGILSIHYYRRNTRWLSATYICRFYILRRKVDSAWVNRI